MKIKQSVTRTETKDIEVDFPLYAQHDVGDDHTYIVTYRYELQWPHVPTFLVTTITETDNDFEVMQRQALVVDTDIEANRISADEWAKAVKKFEKWTEKCLNLLQTMKRD